MPRRFPPPWTVKNNDDAYWLEDAEGHEFGYCYFREDRPANSDPLTRDEARRLVTNFARLPELLRAQAPKPSGTIRGDGEATFPEAPIIGQRIGGEPESEAEHFLVCPACGQAFDMRDLSQVLHHETKGHGPIPGDG